MVQLSVQNNKKSYLELVEQGFGKGARKFAKTMIYAYKIVFLCLLQMLILVFIDKILGDRKSQIKDFNIYMNAALVFLYMLLLVPEKNHVYTFFASGFKQFMFYMLAFTIYIIYWLDYKDPDLQFNEGFKVNVNIIEAVNILVFSYFCPRFIDDVQKIAGNFNAQDRDKILVDFSRDLVIYYFIFSIPGGTLVKGGNPIFIFDNYFLTSPVYYALFCFVFVYMVTIPYQGIFLRDFMLKNNSV